MEIRDIKWNQIKGRIGRWVRGEAHAGQVKYNLESDLNNPFVITQFTVDFENETVSSGWREDLYFGQEEVLLTDEERAEFEAQFANPEERAVAMAGVSAIIAGAGLIYGIGALICWIIYVIALWFVFKKAGEKSNERSCGSGRGKDGFVGRAGQKDRQPFKGLPPAYRRSPGAVRHAGGDCAGRAHRGPGPPAEQRNAEPDPLPGRRAHHSFFFTYSQRGTGGVQPRDYPAPR